MLTQSMYDRIIPLRNLNCYPGNEWLDVIVQLPGPAELARRLWLMTPESSPTLDFGDTILTPQHISKGPPRWIDYGVTALPAAPKLFEMGFFQLRLQGLKVSECAAARLLVTTNLELTLDGCSLETAERKLWGLAHSEAGSTTLHPVGLSAGSPATFSVTYSAGVRGLPAGALIRFCVSKVLSKPQTEDARAPGFVSIVKADGEVTIAAIETATDSHEKTDLICRLESDLAPDEGFTLRYYTNRTYTFFRGPCMKLSDASGILMCRPWRLT